MGLFERHHSNRTERQARGLMRPGEELLAHAIGAAPGGPYLVAGGDQALYIMSLNGLRDVTRLPYEAIVSATLHRTLLVVSTRSGSRFALDLPQGAGSLHTAIAGQTEAHAPRLVS